LGHAIKSPGERISHLNLSTTEEQAQVLSWGQNPKLYPCSCVHTLFEEQVAKTPDAVALDYDDKELSYSELNRRANRLAHYLRELGTSPDARVAICFERGFEMIVAMLAVLKAGGGYVPLDPAYPVERLRFMLNDSDPVALLTQSRLRSLFSEIRPALPILVFTDESPGWQRSTESNPDPDTVGLTPNHLAYVIYTSGSTGVPKGVMVEHANVTRLFSSTKRWFEFGKGDVWTLFHSYAFDFSVWEIWGALLYGGRSIIVPQSVTRSPEEFYSLICRKGVTVLNQTPSAFRQLVCAQERSKASHGLRYVVLGGETLEVSTLKPWYEQNRASRTRLINMYGITEVTVHVTYRVLEQVDTLRRGAKAVSR
jgi:amino acid adenylation domain-containing protein